MDEIPSTQIEEAENRAEENRDHEEYRLKRKLANISAELEKVKTTGEKEVIK